MAAHPESAQRDQFERVALFEPAGILPAKQAEGLKRIKAGFERMAQEFAAV